MLNVLCVQLNSWLIKIDSVPLPGVTTSSPKIAENPAANKCRFDIVKRSNIAYRYERAVRRIFSCKSFVSLHSSRFQGYCGIY